MGAFAQANVGQNIESAKNLPRVKMQHLEHILREILKILLSKHDPSLQLHAAIHTQQPLKTFPTTSNQIFATIVIIVQNWIETGIFGSIW